MRRTRVAAAAVVAAVVGVASYALGGTQAPAPPPASSPSELGPSQGTTAPAATAGRVTAGPSPAPAPPDPSPSAGRTPAAGRTAMPAPSPALPSSVPVILDAAGDVRDEGGVPAPGEPSAADLLRVELAVEGADLVVTAELGGPVPPDAESVLWSVELAVDGTLRHTLSAQQVGSRLVAATYDWSTEVQQPLEGGAALDATTLVLRVPRAALPGLDGAVTWSAGTQRDGGYEDRAPDIGALPIVLDP